MIKKHLNNPFLKKYGGNSVWLIVEKLFRMAFTLFIYGYFSRYLGPEKLGTFNYARSIVTFFLPLASLGLNNIVIRELVRRKEDSNKILGSAFILRGITSLLSLVLAIASAKLLGVESSVLILVSIMALSHIFSFMDVLDLWYQSQVKSEIPVRVRTISFILGYGLFGVGVYLNKPIEFFAWAFAIEYLFISFLFIYYYKKVGKLAEWDFSWREASSLLINGWPLLLQGLMAMIYLRADQIIIGKMLGDTQLGLYSSAVKFTEIWNFIPAAIVATIFPAIVELRSDKKMFNNRMQVLYDFIFWSGIAVGIFTTVFAKQIITIVSGPEFIEASGTLSLYIWSSVMVFLGTASGKHLISKDSQHVLLYKTVISSVINLGLNFWLIPKMGIYGAAIATIVSYSVLALWSNLFFKESREIFFMMLKSFNPFASARRMWDYGQSILTKSVASE